MDTISAITFPEAVRDELKTWLKPVGRSTDEHINQMEQYAQLNADMLAETGQLPTVNLYVCQKNHEIVTVDRIPHAHEMNVTCPVCQQPARSLYYFVDQNLTASHEFYQPAERNLRLYPAYQRQAIREGRLPAFKRILDPEEEYQKKPLVRPSLKASGMVRTPQPPKSKTSNW